MKIPVQSGRYWSSIKACMPVKSVLSVTTLLIVTMPSLHAAPLPGGTLDPLTIPKYVTPLLIPPAMPKSTSDPDVDYQIAVRQFRQQVLPAGFPKTKVWGYGSIDHPGTAANGGTFNFPGLTVEARTYQPTTVRWINDLKKRNGEFLPHLLTGTVDQTLHWANPAKDCIMGAPRTDCAGDNPEPYTGPVPMVVHLHGSHTTPESDGYPEAWWLPDANNIPGDYATRGTLWDESVPNDVEGEAVFTYPNDQATSTLWFHDHSLGMTRQNVYAGPAAFWILRNQDLSEDGFDYDNRRKLPGPAPQLGDDPGTKYYDIPIVIQDRSFNKNGSLFYPKNRAFFEEIPKRKLKIDFAPDSDIAPIWNPEAFFNTMVVNGNTWPYLDVDRTRYRFRLLNGSNSRFLNLSLFVVNQDGTLGDQIPMIVIAAEGGLLPKPVRLTVGKARVFPGNGEFPVLGDHPVHPDQALVLASAERAEVIVNFRQLEPGTRVRMINTAPDAPFGGFPDVPADPETSGQVMEFVVGENEGPRFTHPRFYKLIGPEKLPPADRTRHLSLNEEGSEEVCVITEPNGAIVQLHDILPGPNFHAECVAAGGEEFAPKAALLGLYNPTTGETTPKLWSDPITQKPELGATEEWVLWNFTEDAHPIHLHLVTFEVIDREDQLTGAVRPVEAWETGRKDTVISYPGEITRVKATFDIAGLYVWHCHIVEHEDNEMMLPFCVGEANCPVPVAAGF